MTLDSILKKILYSILTLQKLTNIWVFHVTEDVRQDDVASMLPPEKSTSENEIPVTPPVEAQAINQVTVTKASVRERNLWWLCTTVFMVSLIVYVLFFSPY